MNKIYDKLILAVAALILAGGVVLYLQQSAATPSLNAPVNAQPAENPYQPQAVPSSDSTEAVWPEAVPQSSGWQYEVFTPPKIFIDEKGQFSAIGRKPPPPPVPFGVYLAEIQRKPYRLQLEGYIEEDRSDPLKTLLLMFDEEAQKQVRARPGDVKADAEFELLSFDIERIRDADNNIEVVAKATILDQRSQEQVVITHGERLFDDGVTVIIRSEEDSNYEKVFSEAPAEFEGPDAQYILEEINLEEISVTVKKLANEDEEPETRTLTVRADDASSTPAKTPADKANSEPENMFDFAF